MPAVLQGHAVYIIASVVVRVGVVVSVIVYIDAVNIHTRCRSIDAACVFIGNIRIVDVKAHFVRRHGDSVCQLHLLIVAVIDKHRIDIRVVDVIDIGTVYKLEIIEIDRARRSLSHLCSVYKHETEGHSFKYGIGCVSVELSLAVVPALPPYSGVFIGPGALVAAEGLGLEGKVVLTGGALRILVVAAQPQTCRRAVAVPQDSRSLGRIHPYSDSRRRAGHGEGLRCSDQCALCYGTAVSEVIIQLQAVRSHTHGLIVVYADYLGRLNPAAIVIGRVEIARPFSVLALLVDGVIFLGGNDLGLAGRLVRCLYILEVPYDHGELADDHTELCGNCRVCFIFNGNRAADGESVVCGIRSVGIKGTHRAVRLAPGEIIGRIVDVKVIVFYNKSELCRLGKAQAQLIRLKGYAVGNNEVNFSRAHNGSRAVGQLDCHTSGDTFGADKLTCLCIDLSHARTGFAESPGKVRGQFRCRSRTVGADSTEVNRRALRVILVIRRYDRMIENPRRLCLGNDHKCAERGSFGSVGRNILNLQLAAAFSFRNEGRGSASVTVYRRNAAEAYHSLRKLVCGHTDRARCLSAVDHEEDDLSVLLNAYRSSRCAASGGVVGCRVDILAVLDKQLEGRGSLPLVALKGLVAGSYFRLAVLGKDKIILSRALMMNDTVDNEHSERLIARPGKVCVDRTDNIDAELFFGCCRLRRGRLRAPIIRIHVLIAGQKINVRITEINLHNVTDILVSAGSVVQYDGLLLYSGSNCVILLRHNDVVIVIVNIAVVCNKADACGKCRCGKCADQHYCTQKKRQDTNRVACFHSGFHSGFPP